MTLTEREYKEFLHAHLDLLFFVGKQLNIFSADTEFNDFVDLDLEEKFKCRQAFLENENLLDDYLSVKTDKLSSNRIGILTGFKRKIKSDFIILKCLRDSAIFMDIEDNKFYSVKALSDPFNVFFADFPVLITATILPFKDKIIYDGFIQGGGLYFGPETTWTMNEDYKKAKRKKAIVTTL